MGFMKRQTSVHEQCQKNLYRVIILNWVSIIPNKSNQPTIIYQKLSAYIPIIPHHSLYKLMILWVFNTAHVRKNGPTTRTTPVGWSSKSCHDTSVDRASGHRLSAAAAFSWQRFLIQLWSFISYNML